MIRRFVRWLRTRRLQAEIAYCQNIADDYTLSNTLRSHYRVRAFEARAELKRLQA